MASTKYASYDTMLYFWQKLKLLFAGKVDKVEGKGLSDNNFTNEDVAKLQNISANAEVNQNAFSNIKIGNSTVAADDKTDTLEFVAGTNITLTPDTTNDKITITASGAVESVAGKTGAVTLDKTDVGISDLSQEDATAGIATTGKLITAKVLHDTITGFSGVANGFAPLNSNSKIEASYLPSYVDDIIEVYIVGSTPLASNWFSLTAGGTAITPESGKIYVLMATSGDYNANSQFRWGGTAYVKMADGGVSAITNGEIDTILAT